MVENIVVERRKSGEKLGKVLRLGSTITDDIFQGAFSTSRVSFFSIHRNPGDDV